MKLFRYITLSILISSLISTACSKTNVQNSSPTSTLTANTAITDNLIAKRFGRANLGAGGAASLNEFLRPDVRARLDEEPVGDSDAGYEPGAAAGPDQSQTDASSGESAPEQPQETAPAPNEDDYPAL